MELSENSKYSHHKEFSKYRNRINELIQLFYKKEKFIILTQVSFIVPLGDDFLYIDFPWSKEVDRFNSFLNENKAMRDINDQIFKIHKNQTSETGYIYYEYANNRNGNYVLKNPETNTTCSKDLMLNYLPIINCSMFTDVEDYDKDLDIKINEDVLPEKRILTFCKKTEVDGKEKYSIVVSFEIKDHDDLTWQTKKDRIIKDLDLKVVYFIEQYFDSPVIGKLIENTRKSYILGYKHNLGTKAKSLNSSISRIRNLLINQSEIVNYDRYLDEIEYVVRLYHFTHHLMFDYELAVAGLPANIMYNGSKISDILQDIDSKFNKESTPVSFEFFSDYIPNFNFEDNDFELFDIILIVWNLWNNSIVHSKNRVRIQTDKIANKFQVSFINDGIIEKDYKDFINGSSSVYKQKVDNDDPYHGLQIVMDIINNSAKYEIVALTDSVMNLTKITLTLQL